MAKPEVRHSLPAQGGQVTLPLVINEEISLPTHDHRLRGAQIAVQYIWYAESDPWDRPYWPLRSL